MKTLFRFILLTTIVAIVPDAVIGAQIPLDFDNEFENDIDPPQDVHVRCDSHEILVDIDTTHNVFTGMIYPMGLSKNSSCMSEFNSKPAPITYRLPLRSCNTMSIQMEDGSMEYYNTIIVQPHKKLVTNKGRGFHVRCRYEPKQDAVSRKINSTAETMSILSSSSSSSSMKMPTCTMKIYHKGVSQNEIAENVKIGDPLSIVIALDSQPTYGLFVTDCIVQDGLGWGEQHLIDGEGCPLDREIMGQFQYNSDLTKATVNFQAHKFPYTVSVYYQCNVHMCTHADDGCKNVVPPQCNSGDGKRRNRRDDKGKSKQLTTTDESTPAMIEVYSGLYVNEAADLNRPDQSDQVSMEKTDEDPYSICISQRSFAIGIAIAGIALMLLTVAAVIIILMKHRQKPRKAISTSGSSIYSGPYTNTAYSHTS